MRMHMHYASDLNWRILDDFGQPEVKEKYASLPETRPSSPTSLLPAKTGGTGADLHSTAVWDEEKGKWILNGEKWLISHTDCSQFSYVICVTDPDKEGDERLSAFFVDMSLPGFELVPMPHMMGCRGSGHTGLKFTNVEIDPKFMLGERGQGMGLLCHSLLFRFTSSNLTWVSLSACLRCLCFPCSPIKHLPGVADHQASGYPHEAC